MPTIGADNGGRTGVYYIYPPCPSALSDNVNGQGGQSVRLQNNAFSNASQLQGVRELRVKAEVMQTADRGKIQKIGGENVELNKLHHKLMESMSEKERADFEAGLKALNMANPADRAALRESFKRLRPDATERELDIMVSGEAPPDNPEWLQ